NVLRLLVGQRAGGSQGHRVAQITGKRVDAREACSIVPGAIAPQRPWLYATDVDTLTIHSMTHGALLAKDGLAQDGVQSIDREAALLRDRVQSAPRRRLSQALAAREPVDVRRDSEQLFTVIGWCGAVHAPHEAAADAVLEAEQAALACSRDGKHCRHADERQRTLPLAGVQMAVRTRHRVTRVARCVYGGVRDDVEAAADLPGEE